MEKLFSVPSKELNEVSCQKQSLRSVLEMNYDIFPHSGLLIRNKHNSLSSHYGGTCAAHSNDIKCFTWKKDVPSQRPKVFLTDVNGKYLSKDTTFSEKNNSNLYQNSYKSFLVTCNPKTRERLQNSSQNNMSNHSFEYLNSKPLVFIHSISCIPCHRVALLLSS